MGVTNKFIVGAAALLVGASVAFNPVSAQARADGGADGNNATPGCSGGVCTGASATPSVVNNNTSQGGNGGNNNVKVRVVVAPDMAVSSGWCMESLSVSFGVVAVAGGFSDSEFSELCGRWATMANGATNNNCAVGMYSVLTASGESVANSLEQSINTCYKQNPPVVTTNTKKLNLGG
jgi:hypothetical protein